MSNNVRFKLFYILGFVITVGTIGGGNVGVWDCRKKGAILKSILQKEKEGVARFTLRWR